MSKKEANINLNLSEEVRDGETVSVLREGTHVLGYVHQVNKRFEAVSGEKPVGAKQKTLDDALQELIADLHLHQ